MTDLSALTTLTPEELEAVRVMAGQQGAVDPKQLPGKPQVWQVDNKWYVVYWIPGTQTPMAWEATPQELANAFDDVQDGVPRPPKPDRSMSTEEFVKGGVWVGGRINEIRLQGDHPWNQWMAEFDKSADLRPWLRDPDMLATVATAYLEGRTPTADELSQTRWWQTHSAREREWLENSVTVGGEELRRQASDHVRQTEAMLREAGANNIPQHVAAWMAGQHITGRWGDEYFAEQVRKLADPFAPGELNAGIVERLGKEGVVADTTRREEDVVRNLVTTWLGPQMGQWIPDQVQQWAGRLRNDPDAQIELQELLRRQRQALFPGYENENLTYEDIVSPFRNMATNIWGQPVADETMLVDLANIGDYTEASKRLRKMGLDRGVQKVVYDALGELSSTSLGDRVVTSTI